MTTELVNAETGELIELLTGDEAERLTMRISLKLDSMADAYTGVMPLIREAIERLAFAALGYASLGAYVADRFGGSLAKLGVEVRREVVRELTDAGMSSSAIAPILGVTDRQVRRDASGGTYVPPVQTPAPAPLSTSGAQAETHRDGEPHDDQPVTESLAETTEPERVSGSTPPAPVTGLDGKTYSRPAPKEKPVMDDTEADYDNATKASLSLSRAISRLLTFSHPNMRAGMRRYWDMASSEVPPTPRRDVTPEQMREAAQGNALDGLNSARLNSPPC